ncbi:MAG TPA: hypothetical protein VK995_01050, partial [Oceanipulchritudo sp.]|nr:hypothetical protein [Oceanipulchritudo sp.]
NPALDWTYYNDQLFNLAHGNCWLFSAPLQDFLWFESTSTFPRFFYSYACGEWVTDQDSPPYDPATAALIADQAAVELQQDGITVTVNSELSMAVISAQEIVDGKLVTITIEAPWLYTTRVDYPSHARFELDFSYIQITMDGETITVHSSEFWNLAKVLMPMRLSIDFFFHSQDSGVAVQLVEYNNGTFDPPVREPFGP